MATLKQIAKEAGVSVNTVSRVLTGKNKAQWDSTARRAEQIRAIARRLNYTPNHMARGLRSRSTQAVGVLWSMVGPHPSEAMARRIAVQVQQHGYATYIADHMRDPKLTRQILADFAGRGVDAIAIEASDALMHDEKIVSLLNRFSAAVAVAGTAAEAYRGDLIVHDRSEPLHQVVDHFIASGRTRPAIFCPRNNHAKLETYCNRVREHLGPIEVAHLDLVSSRLGGTAHDYWHMLEKQCAQGLDYDAIWCSTDQGAMATMAWLKKQGLRVPDDVAVVGFNDQSEAAYFDPPLASINMHREQVADLIYQTLFGRLDDPDLPPDIHQVKGEFVWRASAGGHPPASRPPENQTPQRT